MLMTSKIVIKPGDLIEWAYEATDRPVSVDERLWSTPLQRYVPIGSDMIHMLVAVDSDHIMWFNSRGLFHARVDDTEPWLTRLITLEVIPRKRGSADHMNLNPGSEC
jgi:hypothetical protein